MNFEDISSNEKGKCKEKWNEYFNPKTPLERLFIKNFLRMLFFVKCINFPCTVRIDLYFLLSCLQNLDVVILENIVFCCAHRHRVFLKRIFSINVPADTILKKLISICLSDIRESLLKAPQCRGW